MKKISKIQLIEAPRKEEELSTDEMSLLLGGNAYYCPKEYKDGGWFGNDYCGGSYSSGNCGSHDDYCNILSSCTFNLR